MGPRGSQAWPDQPLSVSQDTKVNTIVIPQEELAATDLDKNDILFYTLQEVTPVSTPPSSAPSFPGAPTPPPHSLPGSHLCPPQGAGSVFSLVGTNFPALRLAQALDFDRSQNMTLQLRVRVSRP